MINLIAAVNQKGYIGKNNQLMWNLKDDLELFKQYTQNNIIVMGYNTWVSIYFKPLPYRDNWIISTRLYNQNQNKNIRVFNNIDSMLFFYKENNKKITKNQDLYIIGGKELFLNTLDYVNNAYISLVDNNQIGDISIPFFWHNQSQYQNWQLEKQIDYKANHQNEFSFSFMKWVNKQSFLL